ncbi:hypothetical protein AZE42_08905 [Rhizopogon vesiculosus]|uniref:Uncharacterized protein n=1 Tax=Rhizopogon vesiculosus TaxID=180088 RepID=A0A1J8Q3A1_9AGAM|nr:hypothetical protein AZE42_08905 [Rhizopogon vesiculosus]
MPLLRLIEHEWGGTKDRSTNKECRQTWRPHNDNNVRRQWSQFMFFIKQIKSAMDTGDHASEAVQILDEQCSSMSIPQFHSRLQPKRKWPQASVATSPSASDPQGAVLHV